MSDDISFLPELSPDDGADEGLMPWKVLVVDDDPEIHHVTHLVLDGISYRGRRVSMLSATSAAQARHILANNRDICVMLLDVVMETQDAGLLLVPWVREQLGLSALRIILRTGQPGQAPERDIILRHDINDYRSKSELTAQSLFTAVIAAIRSSEAISSLEISRQTLEARVSERTRALQASEAHVRALLEAVPEGVVTIDAEGTIRTFSPAAERIFGWAAAEVVGKSVKVLMGEPYASQHDANMARYLCTGAGQVIGFGPREVEGLRRDGSSFPLDLSVNRADISGEVIFVSTLRDTTERRQYQETLRRAKEDAEQAARAKSEFLAMMSHEIRTPMNGILGMVQLLIDSGLNERQRDFAETIDHSGRALMTVLNDILDFSKLEAGRLELEIIPFDPLRMVRGVVALMESRISEKGLVCVTEIGHDLPARVMGDPNRLRQVLLNLLSNAIKFTESGGITVTLRRQRSARSGASSLYFAVQDTGIGIPEPARASLFNHFVQADSSISRRFGGTGLGLAISRKIVSLMDGEIGVESCEGVGSTFWFSVDFAVPESPAGEVGHGLEETWARGDLPPLSILLAEDNPVNRKVAQGLLANRGHQVTVAGNGRQAVEAVMQGDFDIVLMDMQMPEVDGLEATRRIRALPGPKSRLPVIALTANAMTDDINNCLLAGMDGHVAKPIDAQSLFRAISDVLYRRLQSWPQAEQASGPGTKVDVAARADTPSVAGEGIFPDVISGGEIPVEGSVEGIIDVDMFSSLCAALGEQGLMDILRLFLSDSRSLVELMEGQCAHGNRQGVAELAQDLRATSGNFGFVTISAAAGQLLQQVDTLPLEGLRLAIADFAPLFDQVVAVLSRWYPQGASRPEAASSGGQGLVSGLSASGG